MRRLTATLAAIAFLASACGKPQSAEPQASVAPSTGVPEETAPPPPDHAYPVNNPPVTPPTPDLPVVESGPYGVDAISDFSTLINSYPEGRPAIKPWANDYWPFTGGGIDSRAHGTPSPAEKYDKARGCGAKSAQWELANHGPHSSPFVAPWWGHCNGWSAAASLYPEPQESVKVNGVVFNRADVKALLTEAGMLTDMQMFGTLVNPSGPVNFDSPEYNDIAPDEYFLVLTNFMGRHEMPIVIDQNTGSEIWNQPLAGYRIDYPTPSDYLGADPEHPDVYRIVVNSRLWWANDMRVYPELPTPDFNFLQNLPSFDTRGLRMEVWLDGPVVFDAAGKITKSGKVLTAHQGQFVIGGEWRDREIGLPLNYAHPDIMWVPHMMLNSIVPANHDPEDPTDANPEIDTDWLVSHLVEGQDDGMPGLSCPTPAPSPSPNPSPSPAPGRPD